MQASLPPLTLRREPGRRYVMLLDRGAREPGEGGGADRPAEHGMAHRQPWRCACSHRGTPGCADLPHTRTPRLPVRPPALPPACPPTTQPPNPPTPSRAAGARRARPCYFLDKAWHAQQAGADALLVVNDTPGQDLSTAVAPTDEDSSRRAGAPRWGGA